MVRGAQTMSALGPVPEVACRLCNAQPLALVKPSNIQSRIASGDVRITDYRYGVTAAVYRCPACGFMQCSEVEGVSEAYRGLEDPEYEETRAERLLQAQVLLAEILRSAGRSPVNATLLDIGAGSGILLEAATSMGFTAEGVEPSQWLQAAARRHGCAVHLGTLPNPAIRESYDVITIVDVIEHVEDPLGLLRTARGLLKAGGIIAIVTPDASSLAARIMGWRWWHYRVAHIGYFKPANLRSACAAIGLNVVSFSRPGWVFSVGYLRKRLVRYLPDWLVPSERPWMYRRVIPLNLRDSMMIVAEKAATTSATV